MDWDWHLIVGVATLIVALIAVVGILIEGDARRSARGLPTVPRPEWRAIGAPTGGVLRIEACNRGAAASRCCVVMQVDQFLYAGAFSLGEQQSWAPQTLEVFDTLDDKTEANSLFCVARNLQGLWSAIAPNQVIEGMPASAIPYEVAKLLRRATGRRYLCALAPDGTLTMMPPPAGLQHSTLTAI